MMACGAGGVAAAGAIELHTAANASAVLTIRMVAADLAARADFDLDSIDDLRMAVHEVCTMLVRIAAPNARLSCRFTVRPDRVELVAEVDVADVADPLPPGSFSWQVLKCLADEVNAFALPAEPGQYGRVCITLVKDTATTQRP
jgi:serine/threonine-protein kinase RsbW